MSGTNIPSSACGESAMVMMDAFLVGDVFSKFPSSAPRVAKGKMAGYCSDEITLATVHRVRFLSCECSLRLV